MFPGPPSKKPGPSELLEVRLPAIDDLTFDDVDVLRPGPGQVAVDIKAVSLNFRDLAVVTGRYPRRVSGPTVRKVYVGSSSDVGRRLVTRSAIFRARGTSARS